MHSPSSSFVRNAAPLFFACALLACTTRVGMAMGDPEWDGESESKLEGEEESPELVQSDEQVPLQGVMDRARDPAVVLLRAPHHDCSATFIAKDVVVTARECVEDAQPSWVSVHVSDEPGDEPPAARGLEVLLPDPSEAPGLAFVVLDATFTTQRPLGLRASDVARGNRLRTVSHADHGGLHAYTSRVLREHVYVRGENTHSFYLAELGCRSLPGGPAIDPSNGQIVGILVGPGDRCEGNLSSNHYVRASAFADAFDRALGRSGLEKLRDKEGNLDAEREPKGATRPGTRKPPTEIGATCGSGADCATGVCITHHQPIDAEDDDDEHDALQLERAYCSRACGRGDRCPAHYRCTFVPDSSSKMCVLAPAP